MATIRSSRIKAEMRRKTRELCAQHNDNDAGRSYKSIGHQFATGSLPQREPIRSRRADIGENRRISKRGAHKPRHKTRRGNRVAAGCV